MPRQRTRYVPVVASPSLAESFMDEVKKTIEKKQGGISSKSKVQPGQAGKMDVTFATETVPKVVTGDGYYRFHLLPLRGMKIATEAMEAGVRTYGEGDWRKKIGSPEFAEQRLNHALLHIHEFTVEPNIVSIGHAIADLMLLAECFYKQYGGW